MASATLAQVARQTRRGLFGLQGHGAGVWNEAIKRFQAARDAIPRTIAVLDESARNITDTRALDALYTTRDALVSQAGVMDAAAQALTHVSRAMQLSGLDDVGLFGILDASPAAYPAACAGLDFMSATAERHSENAMRLAGAFTAWGSFGGDLWEMLHPGQVQQEYTSVGQDAPTKTEIVMGAASDAAERVQEGAIALAGSIKTYAIIGGVLAAVVYLAKK